MLTSVVTSSFPSLILLSLCEKHQQTQITQMPGRCGLQARGEIRKHFGKHFSKHWLKLWGSGFLRVLEWRIHSDAACYIFPISCTHISFSHFRELWRFFGAHIWSCGFANRYQACAELFFFPWCLHVPRAASAHSPSWALLRLSCDKVMCWGTSPGWHWSQDTCSISKSPSNFILGVFSGYCVWHLHI